ncbi:hypothetical protein Ancab_014641 [Ancistrocladus abbreviatus]
MSANADETHMHSGAASCGGGTVAFDDTELMVNSVAMTLAGPLNGGCSSIEEKAGGSVGSNGLEGFGARETLSSEREKGFVDIEANVVGGGDSRVLVDGGKECSVKGGGIGGSGNGGYGGEGLDDLGHEGIEHVDDKPAGRIDGSSGMDLNSMAVGVVNKANSGCGNSDEFLRERVQNIAEDDNFGGDMKAASNYDNLPRGGKNVDGIVLEGNYLSDVENQAVDVGIQPVSNGHQVGDASVTGGGISHSKVINLVIDLNSCIKDGSDFKSEPQIGFPVSNCAAVNVGGDVIADRKSEELVEKREISLVPQLDQKRNNSCKVGFCVSDMVWGKVRGHPWWPGQIFEPWDATEKAKKYFKPNSYLVAYFGDQSFAWNEELKLKPFWPQFTQMAKQSTLEAFQHAVDCALEEAHRRVEFGLTCRCIAEDVYDKIKTQVYVNAGIREQSSIREGGDRFLTALSFEPGKLVNYVKGLAKSPNIEVDRLELVMTRAQLSALYRWKGYYFMAEFKASDELLKNEAHVPVSEDEEDIDEVMVDGTLTSKSGQISSVKGTNVGHHRFPLKQKDISGDKSCPGRKERQLADLMRHRGSGLENVKKETEGKGGRMSFSSSAQKCKAVQSLYSDLEIKDGKRHKQRAAQDMNQSLGVGERIHKFVRKLDSQPQLSFAAKESKRKRTLPPVECSSSDEMLSQLRLAAKDLLFGYSFPGSMVPFFSDFRNSIVQDNQSSEKHEDSVWEVSAGKSNERSTSALNERSEGRNSGLKKERVAKGETIEVSKFEGIEDSYWTDRIISVPEQKAFLVHEDEPEVIPDPPSISGMPAGLLDKASDCDTSTNLDSMRETGSKDKSENYSPTAMILNFSDPDAIPSESKLNNIFRGFGPLLESETEVMKKGKRAKVVFEKVSDAESAFSKSGKFETFGPSLFRYTLDYSPVLRKAPSIKSPLK